MCESVRSWKGEEKDGTSAREGSGLGMREGVG